MKRREHRRVPRAYDDGFRSSIASGIALVVAISGMVIVDAADGPTAGDIVSELPLLLGVLFIAWLLFSAIYLPWTHIVFTRATDAELTRIAGVQHHDRPDLTDHLLGNGGTGTLSASFVALFAAFGAAFIGQDAPWLVPLALVTVASAWLTLGYSFALRYLRLDAAGERISFDIDEKPRFAEFFSMALMISCIGALSAGTPRTRASLRAVRTHTVFAFVFNAFIVAMTVSLVVGVVAA